MRSISSALRNAQKAVTNTPYIRIYLTSSNGKTHKNYTSRLRQLEHREEPYNDWAEIILTDDDLGVADVRGYWIQIGYGNYTNGSSYEYVDTPRMWVKSQHRVSREGELFTILNCEGMWAAIQEQDLITVGEPPWFTEQYDEDYTIYDTIKAILHSITFNTEYFDLDALGSQDDGIIDDFKPAIWVNQTPFENPAQVLYRLVAMTKCYLRPEANLEFKVIYPQEGDSVDETYYSNQTHYFHEYVEKWNVDIPNRIVVYANPGEDVMWTNLITAEATSDDSIEDYHQVTKHHIAMDISDQTDAGNRASAIMTRIMAEQLAGKMILPHDCRVELYDRVRIYDAR